MFISNCLFICFLSLRLLSGQFYCPPLYAMPARLSPCDACLLFTLRCLPAFHLAMLACFSHRLSRQFLKNRAKVQLFFQLCKFSAYKISYSLNVCISNALHRAFRRHFCRRCVCPHHTPYTIHHTPYTIHRTPYTIHHTPYTIHHTPYTVHPTPYTIHRTPNFHLILHERYTKDKRTINEP